MVLDAGSTGTRVHARISDEAAHVCQVANLRREGLMLSDTLDEEHVQQASACLTELDTG